MKREWLFALAVAALPAHLASQQANARIVVLPFEDTGSYGQDKEVFEAMELGLAAMLASSLDRNPRVEVPELARQSEALKAAGVGPGQRMDAATAAQVGKGLGSRYVVTGSFADFYGKFRINARVIEAETGRILQVVSNDDPKLQDRAQLSAILEGLRERILKAADLPSSPSGQAPAIPTDAITDYSRGLLQETRGDRAKAVDYYRRAVTAYPDYQEAQAALRRLGGA